MCESYTILLFWAVRGVGMYLSYLSLKLCPAISHLILPASSEIRIKIISPILQLKTLRLGEVTVLNSNYPSGKVKTWDSLDLKSCPPPAAPAGWSCSPFQGWEDCRPPREGKKWSTPWVPGSRAHRGSAGPVLCSPLVSVEYGLHADSPM